MTGRDVKDFRDSEKERLGRLATDCMRNASDLIKASALLAKNGFYGYGTFMAIASMEETGKAIYSSGRAQGTLPPYSLNVEDHLGKMRLALVSRDLHSVLFTDDLLASQMWTALLAWTRNSDLPEVTQYFDNPTKQGSAEVAVQALAETLQQSQPWIPLFLSTDGRPSPRDTPDFFFRSRAQGLYVDLMVDGVRTPRQFGEADFLRVYRQSSAALEVGHMSLGDDPVPDAGMDLAELLIKAVRTIQFKSLWD